MLHTPIPDGRPASLLHTTSETDLSWEQSTAENVGEGGREQRVVNNSA